MKVAVWDTYVKRADGALMHFDILVPENQSKEQSVLIFGSLYLSTKSFETGTFSASECQFCHIEQAGEDLQKAIREKGFSIIEMENCD
ncbi:DUF2024 family protein [Jiulongibacter sediminis]|uniref:DUF2024 domain-containing protein n=1 Tax=Jiulongibacter sediminis TaxID=1605367 RepID=A0A0P7BTD9_9BACT|nr:DUF2024 family protein [Jiulongibacter sediminis]KPM48088.1 hypothetical protein AFM12_12940 [Jiulongibacter sediminis]TBX24268.1 hypothetical protein TK44_12950 [Jiulongibacter sediminis]